MTVKSFIADVKEMARGVDWVKFLVKFNRIAPGETGSETAVRLHGEWMKASWGPDGFEGGRPKVQRFNFDDDKAVFTFRTEPYSMKSNDYFRYVFDFGQWVDSNRQTYPSATELSFGRDLTISKNPSPLSEERQMAEINSEMEVRSFISRIISKHTV